MRDQDLAHALIGAAAFAAMMLAVYHIGAASGRPKPLPVPPWRHSVAFRLHALRSRS